jgi:hypothetical protein
MSRSTEEIQDMTTAIQRADRGVQLDADFSPGIEISKDGLC